MKHVSWMKVFICIFRGREPVKLDACVKCVTMCHHEAPPASSDELTGNKPTRKMERKASTSAEVCVCCWVESRGLVLHRTTDELPGNV